MTALIEIAVGGRPLAPTLSTAEVAELLGCSTDTLYLSVRQCKPPVEPLRFGTKLRWPTAKVLAVLGLAPPGKQEGSVGDAEPSHSQSEPGEQPRTAPRLVAVGDRR